MLRKISVIMILCGFLELALPWYTIAIVPLIICFIAPSLIFKDFLSGFFAIFLLWLGVELFHDMPNHGLLASKVAGLFHLPSQLILLVVCAALGGLIAAISALCGNYLRILTESGTSNRRTFQRR